MTDARRRRLILLAAPLLLIAGSIAACTGTTETSRDFLVGDPTGEWNAFDPGTVLWIGTSSVTLRPGGDAELLAVEAVGLAPSVRAEPLAIIEHGTGEIGLMPESAVPAPNRALARPLAHARVTPADGPLQVVLRLAMPSSEIMVSGFRLTYIRDGERRTALIPYSDHVCVGWGNACSFVSPGPG